MKFLALPAVAAVILAACTANAADPHYTVKYANPQMPDSLQVFIVDYDNAANLDSTIVINGVATFEGTLQEPRLARLMSAGQRLGTFVLEQGVTDIDAASNATGTPFNEALNAFANGAASLQQLYQECPQGEAGDECRANVEKEYQELYATVMEQNIDNPIGYYLFLQDSYSMDRDQLEAALQKYPGMASYERIRKAREVFDRKDATAPGKMFTDFEVTYDGKTHRLSDYVGKGNYTLVDFWASWCGPCIRETAVIKDIYSKYAPQGLDVVGFAVWDEPENSLAAIDRLALPWKQVIDAQTVPTDAYGILGIPCIILFAPDGTIVARDLQGDELRQAVADAFPDNSTESPAK